MDELDALAAEAATVDASTQTQPVPDTAQGDEPHPEVQSAPVLTPQQEAEGIVSLLAMAVEKLFPVLGYKEETKAEAARVLAPVLEKYNIQDLFFAKYSAEINAVMFFASLGYGSYQAVIEAREAERTKQERDKTGWFAKFFKWGK